MSAPHLTAHPGPAPLRPPADPADLASVEAWILELARRELRLDRPIAPDAELSGALDSLQRLALVVAIEDHLQISFEPEDDEQAMVRAAEKGADCARVAVEMANLLFAIDDQLSADDE